MASALVFSPSSLWHGKSPEKTLKNTALSGDLTKNPYALDAPLQPRCHSGQEDRHPKEVSPVLAQLGILTVFLVILFTGF
jgi:hypothetical protein